MNAPYGGICVEFEREKHHNSLPTFKLPKVLTPVMTDQFNTIFDDFSI